MRLTLQNQSLPRNLLLAREIERTESLKDRIGTMLRGTGNSVSTILVIGIVSTWLIQGVHAETRFSDEAGNCSITGDGDVYGIGIRLSLYLQWVSVIIATWFAPNEARSVRTVTNIVTIAVLANTFKDSGSAGNIVALEWWIVSFNTFILQLGNVPFSRDIIARSASSIGVMMWLWSSIAFANCWVWFAGVNLGKKDGCDVKVFPVSIYNGAWQTFLRIIAVIGGMLGLVFIMIGILAMGWNLTTAFAQRLSKEPSQPRSIRPELFSTAFQIVIGTLAIAVTEMTIKTNDIQMSEPLGSSGQLLPFSIAVVNLGATIGSGFRNLVYAGHMEQERARNYAPVQG